MVTRAGFGASIVIKRAKPMISTNTTRQTTYLSGIGLVEYDTEHEAYGLSGTPLVSGEGWQTIRLQNGDLATGHLESQPDGHILRWSYTVYTRAEKVADK
jgi:hypothetical protein